MADAADEVARAGSALTRSDLLRKGTAAAFAVSMFGGLTDRALSVYGPVNIGNSGEFSIKELAVLVIEKIDTAAGTTFAPLPSDDPRQRQPDISLARKLLGWEPRVPLSEGLDRTIAYFRDL